MADDIQENPEAKPAPQRDFHHPYTPYPIQLDFMNALYDVLEDGSLHVEAYTNKYKGKSLSLICGSLTWLREHKRRKLNDELEEHVDDGKTPAWVLAHARKEKRENALRSRREMEARLQKIREKEKREREQYMRKMNEQQQVRMFGVKRQKPDGSRKAEDLEVLEAQFELDDYHSDDEGGDQSDPAFAGLSKDTIELMKKAGYGPLKSKEEEEEVPDEIKIFYCSRTHSQLSQFTAELRRVHLPPTYEDDPLEESEERPEEVVKHLSLGSRKLLCINEKVNTPSASANTVNDRCLDLQQSKSTENKCPFLLSKADNQRNVLQREFRDLALADIKDIEDLRGVGEKLKICGYYASREAIKPTEIITLPYPLLLQKSSREALNISVKNHVIIIDEAHNLMDAVSNIHSVSISLSQLTRCADNLAAYVLKFGRKLKGGNRVYVAHCHRLVKALKTWLENKFSIQPNASDVKIPTKIPDGTVKQGDLLRLNGIDQINIHKLGKYLEESKLARKVEGYTLFQENEKLADEAKKQKAPAEKARRVATSGGLPVLSHVYAFLVALANPEQEGKVFYGPIDSAGSKDPRATVGLRYMLLDPTHHFKDLVEDARAVVLAGGTMEPMSDYVNHLFPYLPPDRLRMVSCGHVIPKDNMLAMTVPTGITNQEFEFTFEKRNGPKLITELGRTIFNLCKVIPHGVVVFFPSYAYLDTVIKVWEEKGPGGTQSVYESLQSRKVVFREGKGSSSVDDILRDYAKAVDEGKGALLLSVVGGKMSEGINFSDNLGRGVIMVGLPFPNIHTAEWKAKMEFVEQSMIARSQTEDIEVNNPEKAKLQQAAKSAAKEYYENACMRAVNQSIGRAIRHRNDYAVILLLDKRFSRDNIWGKLPKWIRDGKSGPAAGNSGEVRFGMVMTGVGKFFRNKVA
ncbi:ATP-dependent DNA helicase chl1 [Arthrobotrys musiformis]|uniref:ATP-dependent DNA helicase CHL1 n=1 Tax=Arthrobotrys musiformis TaxID=47236 RepID=A0AAV9VPL9_9PEZI